MEARFVVDEEGRRVAVLLDIGEYERMVEVLEDLEDGRLYDEAKAETGKEGPIPWEIGSEYEVPEVRQTHNRSQA